MTHLHVIATLNPAVGGPVEAVRQMDRIAQSIGLDMEVATLDAAATPWAKDFSSPVHCLGPSSLGTFAYCPAVARWLQVNASRFEAVIVHGLWQYHGLATRKALAGSSTPYFVFTHGMLDPWFRRAYPFKHLKKWLYWPWGEYRVLRDARAVLFTCEEEKLLARQSFWLYSVREAVVQFGTQAPPDDADAQRERFLALYPQLRGRRILLFLSRIHPKKGCDLLLQAFARVASSDPDLVLVMAGPDQIGWKRELEILSASLGITERVLWTGMLSGDLKWGAFRAAEAFVLPSHSENFGIVVAEALACGKPVLISNRVNIWREIAQDSAGLVADNTLADTESILRQWLALDASRRRDMGERARKTFFSRFEIEAAGRSLLATVRSRAEAR